MKIFNKQLVDVGKLQGLEAANNSLRQSLDSWRAKAMDEQDNVIDLEAELKESNIKIKELEQVIADNKFLPNNKPNLELAAKTVAAWGNNRTIASFFKKLFFLVDDSMIETIVRYANTEVKKRKLNLEVK